jgi:putative transposase
LIKPCRFLKRTPTNKYNLLVLIVSKKYHQDLIPDNIYHIYSRAVGDEKLFKSDENYRYLLQKFKNYILPIADIYTWTLLPNHFHFMIRIKNIESINEHFSNLKKGAELEPDNVPDFLMQCFSNLLNSYTKSFNKVNNRKGALFIDYLRRVLVDHDSQFVATAFYIHKNAVHHGYCKNMEDWKWSSYNSFLNKEPKEAISIDLLEWFGGMRGFIDYHSQTIYLKNAVIVEE